jgi:pimeloyl-ACP methyl ester carboxylesterase
VPARGAFDDLRITIDDPDVGSLTFDAWACGPAGGDLVLLLHGFPETKRCYRAQLPALGAAGYRAVAVDQRGYSPDARPAGVEAYDLRAITRDVLGIADALGAERFHLVGHDYGAVIGWQVAARHGGRLATYTTLSVGHPIAYLEGYATGDQEERSKYFHWFRDPATDAELGSYDALHALYLAAGLSAEDAHEYATALGSPEAIGAGLNWYRAAGPYMIEDLPPVEVPVLFLWSTEDPALGPESAYGTAAHVDGPYELIVLDGIDHWIPEHAADAVNEHLLAHLARFPVA